MLAGKTATTSCTTFPDFSHSLGVVVVVFVILVGWLHYKFKTRVKSILLFKKIKLNKINTIFKHKIQLIWNSFTNKENLFEHCLLFTKQNKKQEIGGEELAKEREIPPSFFPHRGAHQNNNNHEKWNVNKHVTVKTGHFSKQKGGWRVWRKIETGTILLPVCCYPQVKWRGLFFSSFAWKWDDLRSRTFRFVTVFREMWRCFCFEGVGRGMEFINRLLSS